VYAEGVKTGEATQKVSTSRVYTAETISKALEQSGFQGATESVLQRLKR